MVYQHPSERPSKDNPREISNEDLGAIADAAETPEFQKALGDSLRELYGGHIKPVKHDGTDESSRKKY